MSMERLITKDNIKRFANFSKEIKIMASDSDDVIYITTFYGVFALNKDRTLKLVEKYNESEEAKKAGRKLFIENKKNKITGMTTWETVDELRGAKETLNCMEKKFFTPAEAPYETSTLDAWGDPAYRVKLKDSTIGYLFRGEFINYLSLLLGKDINYSINEFESKKDGGSSALLAAESPNGKAYILGLTHSRSEE